MGGSRLPKRVVIHECRWVQGGQTRGAESRPTGAVVDHPASGDHCRFAEAQATIQATAQATSAGAHPAYAHPGGTAGLATSAPTHGRLGREPGVLRARAIAGAALAAPAAVGSRETGARHA